LNNIIQQVNKACDNQGLEDLLLLGKIL